MSRGLGDPLEPDTWWEENTPTPQPGLTNIQLGGAPSAPLPAGTPLVGGVNPNATNAAPPASGGLQQLWESSGKNPQAFVQAYIAQKGLRGRQTDPAALNDIIGALKSVGVNAALDTRTDAYHKGLMLDGQFVKLLDGSDNWIWQTGNDAAAPGAGGYAPYVPMPLPPGGGTIGQQAAANPLMAGFPEAFNVPKSRAIDPFIAPSIDEVMGDDGYKFRVQQGNAGLQSWAAARGTLNNSETADALIDYNQGAASQEFQNVFNRKYTGWQGNANLFQQQNDTDWMHARDAFLTDWDIWKQTQDRNFNKLYQSATA